jgi:hypothetical protein
MIPRSIASCARLLVVADPVGARGLRRLVLEKELEPDVDEEDEVDDLCRAPVDPWKLEVGSWKRRSDRSQIARGARRSLPGS